MASAICGPPPVVGVVLAGGRSRRMGGGDKCLLPLGGRTLLEHVLARASPQVRRLVLNANGDPARFARYGLPLVPDGVPEYPGPLAGVLAGMEWTRENAPDCPWIATFPADAPFVPKDLTEKLLARARECDAEVAVAEAAGRKHHLAALWAVSLAPSLRQAITLEGSRRVEAWQARVRAEWVSFGCSDPFINVNTPEDLQQAERLLHAGGT